MADRLFLFQDDDTEDTPFRITPKREVGVEEYGSSFINFYNTTLGLPTLEEETGIEVEEEDITELAEPGRPPKEDDPSKDGADLRNILDQQILGGQEGEFTAASQVSFYNEGVPASGTYFDSYSDYLSSAQGGKFADRVGLVQNVLEPTVTGNFKDIDLGAGFGSEVKATAKDVEAGVKEAPSRAERLFTGKLTPEDSKSLARGMVSSAGLVGAGAGTFIGGETVKNAFGNNSFRPASALGAVADIVHAKQYADMSAIRAAVRATGSYDTATGKFVLNPKVDTGFAMTIGNFGITRAPGSGTYTGNTRGMSHEQIKALEAISGGFDPTRGRYNMLNPSKSQTVAESGGMFISDNNMDGFFRANGTFYDPRSGASAAYGRKRDAEKAAATAGISYDEFQNALGVARGGSKTLAAAIQDIKDAKTAAATKTRQEREQREAAAAAEAEAQAAFERGQAARDRMMDRLQRESDNGGTPGTEYSMSDFASDYAASYEGVTDFGFREGGRVGLAMGGAPGMASGFVDRPPEQVPEDQTVADNRPAQLPEGAFVINAAAVEFAGSNDIKDMLLEAHKEAVRRGLTVDKQGNGAKLIDVAISSGEVVVSPHLAKIIGYDRLTKINNRGKPETRERIEENGQQPVGAAEGGFIDQPGELGDVGEDVPMQFEIPAESLEKFKKFGVKKQKREDIKTFIRGLSDEEAMALLLLTETSSSVDPLESMEAIGEVVRNRAASDYKDFKKLNNVKDVLLQQTRKGAFQFSGLEPTTLYNRLTEVRSGTATKGLQKTFAAAQNVLSDDPDRASVQRLPYNTLFYTKSAAPSQWMRQSKDLEFSTEIGGHEFYKPFASPEFP